MEKEIVFWECDEDAEYLTCDTIDEAVEKHLDELDDIENFPDTLKVYGHARRTINRERFRAMIAERAQEYLDEEYGGEYGCDITEEAEKALDVFVDAYIKECTPWQCEKVETKEINVNEWVKEHAPHWLEEKINRDNGDEDGK